MTEIHPFQEILSRNNSSSYLPRARKDQTVEEELLALYEGHSQDEASKYLSFLSQVLKDEIIETLTLRLGILWVYDWEIQIRITLKTLFEPPVVILISLHHNNDKTPGVSWIDEEVSGYGSLWQLPRHLSYDGPYLSLSRLLPCPALAAPCTVKSAQTFLTRKLWEPDNTHSQQNNCSDMCIVIVIVILRQTPNKMFAFNILVTHNHRIIQLLPHVCVISSCALGGCSNRWGRNGYFLSRHGQLPLYNVG